LQHRAGSGPRARPARDHSALPGNRSHQADVQVPGQALPADGCAWGSGEEDFGVSFLRIGGADPPVRSRPPGRLSCLRISAMAGPLLLLALLPPGAFRSYDELPAFVVTPNPVPSIS